MTKEEIYKTIIDKMIATDEDPSDSKNMVIRYSLKIKFQNKIQQHSNAINVVIEIIKLIDKAIIEGDLIIGRNVV